ncbi:MAG: response regulator [Candidatus Omnitrophica bacterium]|nr:response regulator [Candidatus Omnitrophota bacterium]
MLTENKILNSKILIVDDETLSIKLLQNILEKAGYENIFSTTDPREVLRLYKDIKPDLVVLDLNMPYLTGFEVMDQLKKLKDQSYLPILVISSMEALKDRFRALESGGKDFLNKPYDRREVLLRIHNIIEVRLLHQESLTQRKTLDRKVKQRTRELYNTQLDVINRLSRAVDCKDSETGMHINRMSLYSATLATKIGLSKEKCQLILNASPLHDIGKIGIPDSILLKPGKLDMDEWITMQTHTTLGAELLSGGTSKLLKLAREIALYHHEKWDGNGYPTKIKGTKIPLVARICGLCDVFDALTTRRPYKEPWSVEAAITEIQKCSGTHFDPKLVLYFIKCLPQILKIKEKYVDQVPDSK